MGTLQSEKTAAIGVGIDVGDRVFAQFVEMVLHPFGGAEQSRLFAIPRAINNGALGLPTRFDEFTESAGFLELRDEAGDGIFRAVDPGVVVIAANYPLIGIAATGDVRDHVVDWL